MILISAFWLAGFSSNGLIENRIEEIASMIEGFQWRGTFEWESHSDENFGTFQQIPKTIRIQLWMVSDIESSALIYSAISDRGMNFEKIVFGFSCFEQKTKPQCPD